MQRSSCTLAFGLAILLCGVAGPVEAVPITYTLSATATGTIGGSTFTNALVTLTGIGDTDNIVDLGGLEDDGFVIPFGILFANPVSATLSIAGIGVATIQPTAVYSVTVPADLDEDGDNEPPSVIFGTLDAPPALGSFTGFGFALSDSLAGYELRTAIGPITSFGGVGRDPSGDPIITSLGVLRFASDVSESLQSTFTATTRSVPEPGSLLLVGTGLASLVAVRSRYRGRDRTGTSR